MSYFYILCTILLTVYGQIVIKWQVLKAGALPEDGAEKIGFLLHLLLNPWVISAFLAALLASVTWMAVMNLYASFGVRFHNPIVIYHRLTQ